MNEKENREPSEYDYLKEERLGILTDGRRLPTEQEERDAEEEAQEIINARIRERLKNAG